MNRYFKNFILCGDIDHHCLVCQETFQFIIDIERHVRWEKHRRNIKDLNYFPKFKKDFIYKIGYNYYCEICNYVATNIGYLTDHIRDEKHKTAKSNPKSIVKKPLGLCEAGYVVIGKIKLNKQQWHCISDNNICLVCDADVDNMDVHVTLQEHMIKLIQSEIKCEENRYHRVINGGIYQCFTCKKFLNTFKFKEHTKEVCENDVNRINKFIKACCSKDVATDTDDIDEMANFKKKVEKLKELFYIDEKNNKAGCKQCDTFVEINFQTMIGHMQKKHDVSETPNIDSNSDNSEDEMFYKEVNGVVDKGKRRLALSKYGKKHSIKMNYNGSKGFCNICCMYFSAHMNLFKQHVRGAVHRGHLEVKGIKKPKVHEKCPFKTQDISSELITVWFSPEMGSFWVNNEFCVDINSFFLLYFLDDPHLVKTYCYVCEEFFPTGEERDHCTTVKHKTNFNAAKILMAVGEFIREIRPNVYHCGFCNQIIPFWDTVNKHIHSWKHIIPKMDKLRTSHSFEYWVNTAIYITPNDSDEFYSQLLKNVLGFK